LKTSHVIAISPVHWRADCCLATSYKHWSYCCVRLSEMVFIAPLPSYTRYNIIRFAGDLWSMFAYIPIFSVNFRRDLYFSLNKDKFTSINHAFKLISYISLEENHRIEMDKQEIIAFITERGDTFLRPVHSFSFMLSMLSTGANCNIILAFRALLTPFNI
jgi:hypothetical protein